MNDRRKPMEGLAELQALRLRLHDAYRVTTQGTWRKGRTTHETVANFPGKKEPYHIGEFHHADDANFCDVAHDAAPALIEALESLIAFHIDGERLFADPLAVGGVPQGYTDQKCLPEGIRPKIVTTLNARQLHQAWELANPDPGDQDQEETDISIRWWPGGKDTDGNDAAEGYYAHITDYPEEGSLWLDPDRPIDAAQAPQADKGPTDAEMLDWLETAYTTGGFKPKPWRDFMTQVAHLGYRAAISKAMKGRQP